MSNPVSKNIVLFDKPQPPAAKTYMEFSENYFSFHLPRYLLNVVIGTYLYLAFSCLAGVFMGCLGIISNLIAAAICLIGCALMTILVLFPVIAICALAYWFFISIH